MSPPLLSTLNEVLMKQVFQTQTTQDLTHLKWEENHSVSFNTAKHNIHKSCATVACMVCVCVCV